MFDPSGSMPLPRWVTRLCWSPVVGCETFDRAVAMAHALAQAARPGASLSESAHWVERAEALLAPLLFAAALGGRSIASLCQWVLARRSAASPKPCRGRRTRAGRRHPDRRGRHRRAGALGNLLDRRRICSSAYRSDAVLESAVTPNFDPVAFAASSDTLYICAPAQVQDQLAPLVVALLEAIRAATFARPADAAPVVFALDEVANIAPLASLPALAAEGGGHGLVTLACLQDLSQARFRWGEVAEGFLTLFGAKVILPGIADYRTLQLISALAGDHDVETTTIGRTVGNYGRIRPSVAVSKVRRPRLPVDAIAQGRPGHGLLISGTAMSEVRLTPWWDHACWNQKLASRSALRGTTCCQHDPG